MHKKNPSCQLFLPRSRVSLLQTAPRHLHTFRPPSLLFSSPEIQTLRTINHTMLRGCLCTTLGMHTQIIATGWPEWRSSRTTVWGDIWAFPQQCILNVWGKDQKRMYGVGVKHTYMHNTHTPLFGFPSKGNGEIRLTRLSGGGGGGGGGVSTQVCIYVLYMYVCSLNGLYGTKQAREWVEILSLINFPLTGRRRPLPPDTLSYLEPKNTQRGLERGVYIRNIDCYIVVWGGGRGVDICLFLQYYHYAFFRVLIIYVYIDTYIHASMNLYV